MKARAASWLLALLLALALLQPLAYLHLVFLDFSVGDEGVILAGAQRILRGQEPYRDFFLFHMPGPLYLAAGWLRLFGATLASARALAWLINALLIAGLIGLARASRLPRSALVVILLAQIAVGFAFSPILSHHWMANAFLALSAALLAASGGCERTGRLLGSGALAGIAGVMLQDQGAYWILLVVLLLLGSGGRRRWAGAGAFLLGGAAAAGPIAAYLLLRTPISRVAGMVLGVPLRLYHAHPGNRIPWGGGWLIPFRQLGDFWSAGEVGIVGASTLAQGVGQTVLLIALPVAALLALLRILRLRTLGARQRWLWLVLVCFAAAPALMALRRPTIVNLGFAFPGALFLILWELERVRQKRPRLAAGLSLASLAAPLALTAALYSLIVPYLGPAAAFHFPAGRLESEVPAERITWELLQEFNARSYRPGDTLFCYAYCSFYYFLLQIPGPTSYDNLDIARYDPEMTSRLLAELAARPPDWLLLDGRYRREGRADPVEAWAAGRYEQVARTPNLLIARKTIRAGPHRH